MGDVHRRPQFRVTVNSRCGRACFYCRPSGEGLSTAPSQQLSPDDLFRVARAIRTTGINSIKLTGGDPALYEPLVDVVSGLKTMDFNVEVISRNPRIASLAASLASVGLDLLNISVDTLDPNLHRRIGGVDDLTAVLHAVECAVEAGLLVKVNAVVMSGVNEDEILNLVDYCGRVGVRTLKLLDVIDDLDQGEESFARRLRDVAPSLRHLYTGFDEITAALEIAASTHSVRHQGDLGHPMRSFVMPGGLEVLVKDSRAGAWYGNLCSGCNFYPCHDALMALRLTADNRLQFCLLQSTTAIDLSAALALPSDEALHEAVVQAVGQYRDTWFVGPEVARRRPIPVIGGR